MRVESIEIFDGYGALSGNRSNINVDSLCLCWNMTLYDTHLTVKMMNTSNWATFKIYNSIFMVDYLCIYPLYGYIRIQDSTMIVKTQLINGGGIIEMINTNFTAPYVNNYQIFYVNGGSIIGNMFLHQGYSMQLNNTKVDVVTFLCMYLEPINPAGSEFTFLLIHI